MRGRLVNWYWLLMWRMFRRSRRGLQNYDLESFCKTVAPADFSGGTDDNPWFD